MRSQLYQRALRTLGLTSAIAAKHLNSGITELPGVGWSMIVPSALLAYVRQLPAHGHECPAGKEKIRRLLSLALPVENLRVCILIELSWTKSRTYTVRMPRR